MDNSDHLGKPNYFQATVWSLKTKKHSKCFNFLNFLREIKDRFSQFDVFINAFTLSPLNGVSSRFFLSLNDKFNCLVPSNTFRKVMLNETSSWL